MKQFRLLSVVASAALIGNFAFADSISDGDTFDASDWKSSTNIKVVDSTAGSVEMNITATDVDNDTLNINAGDDEKAILDWTKLDVDSDKYLKFGGSDSIYLNKVSGDDASDLLGSITDEDGSSTVIIVNPNGINVGGDANIEVGELFLSTEDFVRYDGDDIDDNASNLGREIYGFDTDDNATDIIIENGANIDAEYLVLVDDGGKIDINASIEVEHVIATNIGYEGDDNFTIASSDVIIEENGSLNTYYNDDDDDDDEDSNVIALFGKNITIKNSIGGDTEELILITDSGDIVTQNDAVVRANEITVGADLDKFQSGDISISTGTSSIKVGNAKSIYITNTGDLNISKAENSSLIENNLTVVLDSDSLYLESNLTAGDTITLDNIHSLYLKDNEINATTLNISTDRYIYFEDYNSDGYFYFDEDRLNQLNVKNLTFTTTEGINFYDDTNLTKFDSVTLNALDGNDDLYDDYYNNNIYIDSYEKVTANKLTLNSEDYVYVDGDINATNLNIKTDNYFYQTSSYGSRIDVNETLKIEGNGYISLYGEVNAKDIDINTTNYINFDGDITAENILANTTNNININNDLVADNVELNGNDITIGSYDSITANNIKLNANDDININGDITAENIDIKAGLSLDSYYSSEIEANNTINIVTNRLDLDGDITAKNIVLDVNDTSDYSNGTFIADEMNITAHDEPIEINDIDSKNINLNVSDITFNKLSSDDNITISGSADRISINSNDYNYDNVITINNDKNLELGMIDTRGDLVVNSDKNLTINGDVDANNVSLVADNVDMNNETDEGYYDINYITVNNLDVDASSITLKNVHASDEVNVYNGENGIDIEIDGGNDIVNIVDAKEATIRGKEVNVDFLVDDNITLNSQIDNLSITANHNVTINDLGNYWYDEYDEYDNYIGEAYFRLESLENNNEALTITSNRNIALNTDVDVSSLTIDTTGDLISSGYDIISDNIDINASRIGSIEDGEYEYYDYENDEYKIVDEGFMDVSPIHLKTNDDAKVVLHSSEGVIAVDTNGSITLDNISFEDGGELYVEAPTINLSQNFDDIDVELVSNDINFNQDIKVNDLIIDSDDDITISKNITATGNVALQTSNDIILDANITANTISLSTNGDMYYEDEYYYNDPYLGTGLAANIGGEIVQKSGILHSTATYGTGLILTSHTIGDKDNHLVYKSDADWADENVIVNLGKLDESSALYLDSNITESDFDSNRDYPSWIVFNKLESPSLDFNLSFYDNQEDEINDGILDFDATALNSIRYDSLYNQNFINIVRLQEDVDTLKEDYDYLLDSMDILETEVSYNMARLDALADFKVDDEAVSIDDYMDDSSIFDSDDLVIELKEAVDASNAKASETALSEVADTTNTLEEENNEGSLFVDFFKKLFGDS